MADRENQLCDRRRESRKRGYESTQGHHEGMEERAVLRELTNNIAPNGRRLNINPGPGKTRKRKPEPVPKKEEVGVVAEEKVNDEIGVNVAAVDVRAGSDESPGIGHASLLYQHLHSLEVNLCAILLVKFFYFTMIMIGCEAAREIQRNSWKWQRIILTKPRNQATSLKSREKHPGIDTYCSISHHAAVHFHFHALVSLHFFIKKIKIEDRNTMSRCFSSS